MSEIIPSPESTELIPGEDPRAIVAKVFAQPFDVGVVIDGADITPDMVKRRGTRVEIALPTGAAIVNKVTPEQLLAVVAAIIATSKTATEACVRIRAEVSGWKFQAPDGSIA